MMTYNRRLRIHIKKLFYQKLELSYKDIFKKGNKENKTNLFTAYPQYSAMYKSPQAVGGLNLSKIVILLQSSRQILHDTVLLQ